MEQSEAEIGGNGGPDDQNYYDDEEGTLMPSINRESAYSQVMAKRQH